MTFVVLLVTAAQVVGQPAAGTPSAEAASKADIAARIRSAGAAAGVPASAPAAAAPGVVAEDPRDAAYLIGKEIRCPVCQGMSIADSPSEMAQDMMKRVRAMFGAGKTREEIFAFFTRSYGDWVMLRPKASGINWLVWLLPPAAFVLGIYGIRRYIRGSNVEPNAERADDSPGGDDEYLRRVREEVER